MDEKRRLINSEQAISVLPEGEEIHVFRNAGFGLIGNDIERKDLENKICKSDYIELTGATAQSLKHGIAIYNKGDTQGNFIFIETDMEKLKKLEQVIISEQ